MDFASPSVTGSSPELGLPLFLLAVVFGLSGLILLQIIVLRASHIARTRRHHEFLDTWRPIIVSTMMGVAEQLPEQLPALPSAFAKEFMLEWNEYYEKLGGESRTHLRALAQRLNMHRYALDLLLNRQVKYRLLGIVTLGHMQHSESWQILSRLAQSSQTVVAMSAFRAMIRINGARAIEENLDQVLQREDWPAVVVARILKEADNVSVCEHLVAAIERTTEPELQRLLRFLEAIHCPSIVNTLRNAVSRDLDGTTISQCLQVLNDPAGIDLPRRFADHPRWHVRARAALVLGRIGTEQDVPLLLKLLHDKEWWVRHRAGESLIHLPFMNSNRIAEIRAQLHDVFAQDALTQAMAEKELS